MKLLKKQMLLCSILFLVFTLSACSAIGQTDENNLTDRATIFSQPGRIFRVTERAARIDRAGVIGRGSNGAVRPVQ